MAFNGTVDFNGCKDGQLDNQLTQNQSNGIEYNNGTQVKHEQIKILKKLKDFLE